MKIGMPHDELPPHDPDSEAALISCAMQSPVKHFPQVIHKIQPEMFYVLKHRTIWSLMRSKHEHGEHIDIITIMQGLKQAGDFGNMGGIEWLAGIQDLSPTPENIFEYSDKVLELHHRRRILQCSIAISNMVLEGAERSEIDSQIEKINGDTGIRPVAVNSGIESSNLMIDDLQRRYDLNGALSGIDTGFWEMNGLTDGIQYGEQTIIGARPSMGKTAIGLNIFQKSAFDLKIPSLFISLEMSTAALMKRLLSSYMSVPMGDIRRGSYTPSDFAKFSLFKSRCAEAPMFIADAVSGSSIGDISSTVRDYVRRFGVKLVVIDYLQKIKPSAKQEKKTYEIGDVSGQLKGLAVDTGAAFVTLAQLNRETEKDKGRTPRISDLADSGQIERDGDTIMLIHRDRSDKTGATKIIIGKQRDGEVGVVDLIFNGTFCKFENSPIKTQSVSTTNQSTD